MKLLQDAQFEELSVEDLLLTDALNNDYLLTLPIYVDWKKAFESNAIIFRCDPSLFILVKHLDFDILLKQLIVAIHIFFLLV